MQFEEASENTEFDASEVKNPQGSIAGEPRLPRTYERKRDTRIRDSHGRRGRRSKHRTKGGQSRTKRAK